MMSEVKQASQTMTIRELHYLNYLEIGMYRVICIPYGD
jgi:hypothetical protein